MTCIHLRERRVGYHIFEVCDADGKGLYPCSTIMNVGECPMNREMSKRYV